ncbi:ATP-dependent DNA helicase [Oceanimonas baumannii]|uniref:ATP-dependent DNA helicase DinG n=1 Tax=Oceanimonas baumannii TaxID=129578 RepID=A0A235CGZ7_9GAMM|nr:ATP-dependent DNA helicase [Oceanimonas baumannii]OYD23878.1 ATP-dependent helicase [Oceanimonas baumannii]TDW58793.1 ATP-dependent DNA helicase DinG [Oceanimonas baumannii]
MDATDSHSHVLFDPEGPLAKAIEGFSPRAAQLEMSAAVSRAMQDRIPLVVEAGTGTGKTFAYLAPALAAGKKVVVSTGSRNLQEQLYHRDLPTLVQALGYAHPVALLKGRSNYLCIERLGRLNDAVPGMSSAALADLQTVKRFAPLTTSGDVGDIPGLSERSELLPLITSTNDNCAGRDCAHYQECYLVKARNKAMEAQVVVVNHHLFFADMAVRDTGFGQLIPDAEVCILDEAHQLPEIAGQYFGQSQSGRQFSELSRDMRLAQKTEAKDMAQITKAADQLERCAQDFRLAFGLDSGRGQLRPALGRSVIAQALSRLNDSLSFTHEVLKLALGRGEQLDQCFERLIGLRTQLEALTRVEENGYSFWYDCSRLHVTLHKTPLSVAERFSAELAREEVSWIFTSATLAVGDSFEHFCNDLGLSECRTLQLDSPFDYPRQSRLCVPRYLPETSGAGRGRMLAHSLLETLEKVPGGTFFLCTSYQVMREVAEVLRAQLDRSVLMQGEDNKVRLLEQFSQDGRAVLVATGSFWEGIDVRGRALQCVVIDKLPFAAPDDPLLSARLEDCRRKGEDGFARVQLPKAIITLKQGVGRLIRDVEDKGVLVITDARLVNRAYGADFIASLPAMPRTRSLRALNEFLLNLE